MLAMTIGAHGSLSDAAGDGFTVNTFTICSEHIGVTAAARLGKIRTIDGLSSGNALHPVQQAFVDHDGLMCGFCTPGFIMASVALLEGNPNPTEEQLNRGLDGNICRCGTFVRIKEAVMSVKGVPRG